MSIEPCATKYELCLVHMAVRSSQAARSCPVFKVTPIRTCHLYAENWPSSPFLCVTLWKSTNANLNARNIFDKPGATVLVTSQSTDRCCRYCTISTKIFHYRVTVFHEEYCPWLEDRRHFREQAAIFWSSDLRDGDRNDWHCNLPEMRGYRKMDAATFWWLIRQTGSSSWYSTPRSYAELSFYEQSISQFLVTVERIRSDAICYTSLHNANRKNSYLNNPVRLLVINPLCPAVETKANVNISIARLISGTKLMCTNTVCPHGLA